MKETAIAGGRNASVGTDAIGPREFAWICSFLRGQTGIELKEGKQALVAGRLGRRLQVLGLPSYADYFQLIGRPGAEEETQIAIDLLTTNETSFFREPAHFELLPELVTARPATHAEPVRVWSAASSSGEEAYTIAMVLAATLGAAPWEVWGSDISTRVLATAQHALYDVSAAGRIPKTLLKEYALRGTGEYEGLLTFTRELRSRVSFGPANLTQPLPDVGEFDVIFLRNVLIYFSAETKQDIVSRLVRHLRPGGHFLIGHAETLNGLDLPLRTVAPSVYRVQVEQ